MNRTSEEGDRKSDSIGLLAKGFRWHINEQSAVLVSTSPWKNLGFISLHLKSGNGEMFFCLVGLFHCFDFYVLGVRDGTDFLQSIPQGTTVF